MPMPEQYYDSPLSGQQLDAAFRQMQGIEQTVSRVQSNASAAAQSASQASSSASAASSSATRAGQSATQAQNSASAASSSASAAAESARQAAGSAASIEGDADAAAQSASNAQGHAQAAQNAAAQAAQSASDAEDAAERAGQIADFNPADFATAAQGEKADTAVQSVNGKSGTAVTLAPSDIGAATAAQGAKADTALQPGALNGYAQTSDIPDKLPSPQALTIRLGSGGSPTTYDGSAARSVTITPEAIGAQPEGESGGGSAAQYIVDTRLTTWASGATYQSAGAVGYDLLGIVCLCRGSTAADEYSSIQWFPVPESGQSRKYGLVCMNVAEVGSGLMGEAQTRVISIANNGSSIQLKSESAGYYYNWGNKGQDDTCAVPAFLYGMKF